MSFWVVKHIHVLGGLYTLAPWGQKLLCSEPLGGLYTLAPWGQKLLCSEPF